MQGKPVSELLLAEVGEETSSNIDRADKTEHHFLYVKGNYNVRGKQQSTFAAKKKKKVENMR